MNESSETIGVSLSGKKARRGRPKIVSATEPDRTLSQALSARGAETSQARRSKRLCSRNESDMVSQDSTSFDTQSLKTIEGLPGL